MLSVFDSWRVPMNIALDYSWACADKEWQQGYGQIKFKTSLYSQGIDTFVDQYNVDGTTVAEILDAGGYKQLRHSLGLFTRRSSFTGYYAHKEL